VEGVEGDEAALAEAELWLNLAEAALLLLQPTSMGDGVSGARMATCALWEA
jgi:hypothetical protein